MAFVFGLEEISLIALPSIMIFIVFFAAHLSLQKIMKKEMNYKKSLKVSIVLTAIYAVISLFRIALM